MQTVDLRTQAATARGGPHGWCGGVLKGVRRRATRDGGSRTKPRVAVGRDRMDNYSDLPLRSSGIPRRSPELASPLKGVTQLRRGRREEIFGRTDGKGPGDRDPQRFTNGSQRAARQLTRARLALYNSALRTDPRLGRTGALRGHQSVPAAGRENGHTPTSSAG